MCSIQGTLKANLSEAATQSHRSCSIKKGVFWNCQNSQENTCAFLIKLQALACTFIKKETLAQVFSWKFFYRTPLVAISKLCCLLIYEQELLTYFIPLVYFYTSWEQQKISDFLMLLGVIEKDHWHEMA